MLARATAEKMLHKDMKRMLKISLSLVFMYFVSFQPKHFLELNSIYAIDASVKLSNSFQSAKR